MACWSVSGSGALTKDQLPTSEVGNSLDQAETLRAQVVGKVQGAHEPFHVFSASDQQEHHQELPKVQHTCSSKSSHTMTSSQQATKPGDPQKPLKPVDILQNQPSILFANLHTVLLLSLVPISFRSLVNDPVNTLLGLAPTVAIVQAIYCIVCLPSTGQTPPPAHKPGQKKKSGKPVQDIWAKVVVRSR